MPINRRLQIFAAGELKPWMQQPGESTQDYLARSKREQEEFLKRSSDAVNQYRQEESSRKERAGKQDNAAVRTALKPFLDPLKKLGFTVAYDAKSGIEAEYVLNNKSKKFTGSALLWARSTGGDLSGSLLIEWEAGSKHGKIAQKSLDADTLEDLTANVKRQIKILQDAPTQLQAALKKLK